MHLVLVSAFQYPNGGPAAARHLALASGLLAEGNKVSVILLNQVEPERGDDVVEAMCWTTVASGGQSSVQWRIRAARRLGQALDAILVDGHIDVVLLTGLDSVLLEAGLRAAKKRELLVLHELTEYPDVVGSGGLYDRIGRRLFERRFVPAFDGMLVISRALHAYARARTSAPIQIIGAMIDTSRHTPFPLHTPGSKISVGYAGSLSEAKDGVLTLLAAVAKARLMLAPDLELAAHILGDTRSPDGQLAVGQTRKLGLENCVTFHGLVPHAEVRRRLQQCHVLALPRPDSRQARGGFPTKLGEYLCSARPVLTTSVGDIPLYLEHRDNCFMVRPGDEDDLAQKLVFIAKNYNEALHIGKRGRELVEELFDARVQARKVVAFVKQLRA